MSFVIRHIVIVTLGLANRDFAPRRTGPLQRVLIRVHERGMARNLLRMFTLTIYRLFERKVIPTNLANRIVSLQIRLARAIVGWLVRLERNRFDVTLVRHNVAQKMFGCSTLGGCCY